MIYTQATCSNLGIFDGSKYLPEPDCVECVKDLIRFLRRDDDNHCVRRALGDLGVLRSDLVPLLRWEKLVLEVCHEAFLQGPP